MYDSKYAFLQALNDPKIKAQAYFLVNDKSLRSSLQKKYGDLFLSTNNLHELWKVLTARVWVTSSLETPLQGLFSNFRRTTIHLGHGSLFKKVGLLETKLSFFKGLYYKLNPFRFSYFLASSSYQVKKVSESFGVSPKKVFVDRPPRLTNQLQMAETKFGRSFLFAPTWRPKQRNLLGDIDFKALQNVLAETDSYLFLKPHPMFRQSMEQVCDERIRLYSDEFSGEVYDHIGSFAGLITDASSLALDCAALNKPVFVARILEEEFLAEVGYFDDIYDVVKQYPLFTTEAITSFIRDPLTYKEPSERLSQEIQAETGEVLRLIGYSLELNRY
jgi:CDP-glycerol glycerophosphotransferase